VEWGWGQFIWKRKQEVGQPRRKFVSSAPVGEVENWLRYAFLRNEVTFRYDLKQTNK
jgi:hypothetical protein